MDDKRFCPIPFREFRISTAGDLSLCSPRRLKIPIVGNILRDGVEGAWDSARAQELRASILDGSFRYCDPQICPALQCGSLPSVRGMKDPKYLDIIENDRTRIPSGPETLSLHYDPTCNLKCPSCRPEIIGLKGKHLDRVLKIQSLITDSALLEGAKSLLLSGYGDVLASKSHLRLLRALTGERYPDLRIILLTNGLLLTPRMWDTFPGAHPLIREVAVSIDAATPETYRINRGGQFDKLVENLHFIKGLREADRIETFRLNFVVQKNNFREMPEFVRLGRSVSADRIIFQKIGNAPNAGMDDYPDRAIHLPEHPDHAEFLNVIAAGELADPIVDFYTLGSFKR